MQWLFVTLSLSQVYGTRPQWYMKMEQRQYSVRVTEKEASEYMGRDIKECYSDAILMQELLEKTELKFEHKGSRVRAKKVLSSAYEKEILRQLKEYE